jgi:hypothetical protein
VQASTPCASAAAAAVALEVLHRHRDAGDRVLIATGAPPELARAILDFVAHEDLPVIGSLSSRSSAAVTDQHCHAQNKMRMIWDAATTDRDRLFRQQRRPAAVAVRGAPVVVNPKPRASRCSAGCCRRARRSSTGVARSRGRSGRLIAFCGDRSPPAVRSELLDEAQRAVAVAAGAVERVRPRCAAIRWSIRSAPRRRCGATLASRSKRGRCHGVGARA